MNPVTQPDRALENAFRRFEDAANQLENRHAGLQEEVSRLERKLIDSNRRLEAVLDALSSGVAVLSREGELLRTNESFDEMNLVDENGAPRETAMAELLEADPLSGGGARFQVESKRGRRDVAATLIPVGDAEGTQVLTVQDVTDIRREEEEGGRRRRLEALGRMAAELAHEVRNPLGSIRLFACMLRDDLRDRGDQHEMTEQILAATAGLESIVSNLLAFAAPSRGGSRPVDLAEIAREACSLLGPACSVRGVSLKGPDTEVHVPISADPEGMRQVVLNLLGNALAATDTGGSIQIDAGGSRSHATLSVVDDGRGIIAEDLPRVFDPFFSRSEGGSGLGLSIVHGILERHGGTIVLDSREGEGTRARVELPKNGDHHV